MTQDQTDHQEVVGLDNPQIPLSNQQAEKETLQKDSEFGSLNKGSGIPSWAELTGEPHFNIGIVIDASTTNDRYITAISKPASSCSVTSIVVLHPQQDETKPESNSISEWLVSNQLEDVSDDMKIGWGQEGFREILESDIDAVYIIVPPGSQRDYVLSSLEAGKHVLLNDPVSTSLAEFREQQEFAKRYGKFIQFSTMFVHQYRVRRFIDRILCDADFGRIHTVDAFVRLSYDDAEKVGVKLPLGTNSGCIRVLGRFGVLVSTLFFSRVGSFAHSAKCEAVETGKNGELISAVCTVKFTEGRQLKFDVGYIHSATRQSIELQADSRYAQMKDFIIEHQDGLATYRVYEKAPLPSGKQEVVSGEAIDVAGGPQQNMMMWRNFVSLCHSIDKQGGWDQSEDTAQCRELANVAIQTKRVLMALVKSRENNSEEVIIDDID